MMPGLPGTGKSALATKLLNIIKEIENLR